MTSDVNATAPSATTTAGNPRREAARGREFGARLDAEVREVQHDVRSRQAPEERGPGAGIPARRSSAILAHRPGDVARAAPEEPRPQAGPETVPEDARPTAGGQPPDPAAARPAKGTSEARDAADQEAEAELAVSREAAAEANGLGRAEVGPTPLWPGSASQAAQAGPAAPPGAPGAAAPALPAPAESHRRDGEAPDGPTGPDLRGTSLPSPFHDRGIAGSAGRQPRGTTGAVERRAAAGGMADERALDTTEAARTNPEATSAGDGTSPTAAEAAEGKPAPAHGGPPPHAEIPPPGQPGGPPSHAQSLVPPSCMAVAQGGVGTADQGRGAAAAGAAPSPPGRGGGPSPAQQVGAVVFALAGSGPGDARSLSIRLDPLELGRVEIRIERAGDGATSVEVIAEKPETLALLQHDHGGLTRALDQAGVGQQQGRSMSFSLATQDRDSGAPGDGGSGSGRPGGDRRAWPREAVATTSAAARGSHRVGIDLIA